MALGPILEEREWIILQNFANDHCPYHAAGMQGPCLHYTIGKIAGMELRIVGRTLSTGFGHQSVPLPSEIPEDPSTTLLLEKKSRKRARGD